MAKVPILNKTGFIWRETFRNVADVIENGGSINGAPTISEGFFGDGSADYVDYGKQVYDPSGKTELTLFAEVISTAGALDDGIMGWWDGSNGVFIQSQTTGGAEGLLVLCGDSTDYAWVDVDTSTSEIQVALVYDGNGAANADRLKLYVDGVEQTLTFHGSASIPASIPTLTDTTLQVGNIPNLTRYWDGDIYEARLCTHALAAKELSDIYNSGKDTELTFAEIDDAQAVVSLSLRSHYNDGANDVTENIGLETNPTVGDGSTASTQPTIITPHGAEFDPSVSDRYYRWATSPMHTIGATAVSFSCMVYVKLADLNGTAMSLWDSSAENPASFDGFLVWLDDRGGARPNNGVLASFATATGTSIIVDSSDNILFDGWNHIIAVYHTSGNGDIYINGRRDNATKTGSGTGNFTPRNGEALIGTTSVSGFAVDGRIKFPRVYNSSVTTTQAKFIHQMDKLRLNV